MPYRPSPRQLEYLVALGETGHFGAAARKCEVSQPTLSVQVQLIEEQLGLALFERTPGNVQPTPAGRTVIAGARRILAEIDAMVAAASSGRANLAARSASASPPPSGPISCPSCCRACMRPGPS